MNGERLRSVWQRFREKMKNLRSRQKEILGVFSKHAEEEKMKAIRDQLNNDGK